MISLIKKKGINPQDKSTLYFAQWTRVSTVNETQLAKRMARGSTFSVGEVNGVFADFPQSIIDELLNGNAVRIAGLGTFKLKVSGKSQKEKADVTSVGAIISVVFEPAAELTSRLNDEREFRFVEVPTAEGQQDAEGGDTPDTGDDNQGGGGTVTPDPGTGGGDSGGGGTVTPDPGTGGGDSGGGGDPVPGGDE
jgi:predicted histone-like DNA-binding protein